ncbi:hypothetical protein [Brachyspira catarrhinii]|uniref:DUF1376 domain-containing protein n=1 Tax=Brachyspira catarrhinii TaxID=2528966 RepID=A0ABY2TPI1_9SPIR|nr:hypothetical protein [Brachyspira catarrhinii]TKZ26328.1 hypothetical protein EZH24_12250 [Brachyspira catarrhinii]
MEKEQKFIALYGELNSPEDFLTVPFEILEYRRELNITASEFTFICEIFHLTSKDFNLIKDKDITGNKIRFCRQRASLKSKEYLKIKLIKNYKKGGIIYDFRELKKIIDKLKKSKLKKSKKETETKIKVETKNDINQKYEEDAFIKKYNGLLLKLLGVDFSNYQKAQNGIKKYLLATFINRKNTLSKSLKIAEQSFLKLPPEKRNYLKLQDCMINALLNGNEIKDEKLEKETEAKDKKSIPNGIDNLNKLLKVIEKKGDINETYKTITNTA